MADSHRSCTFLAGAAFLDADLAADACGCLPLAGGFLRKGTACGAAAGASSGSRALASAHALRRAALISSMVTSRLPARGQQAHQAPPTCYCVKQSSTLQCKTLNELKARRRKEACRQEARTRQHLGRCICDGRVGGLRVRRAALRPAQAGQPARDAAAAARHAPLQRLR